MKLLLIETGGTIVMAPGPDGLAPVAGLLDRAIAHRTQGIDLRRVTFDPLVDSAEMGPAEWNDILDAITAAPDRVALVTHGTDTMPFTAAAIAQALAGTGHRVILCGSMHPLGQGGDAEGNLDLALNAAAQTEPGVYLAFAGRLWPAAGLVKRHSSANEAFASVEQDPLSRPIRARFDARRLAILTLTPGIPAAALRAALSELDGAVLRVFGAGGAMSDPAIHQALEEAVSAGKPIRAVSMCEGGGIAPGTYASGAALWKCGVTSGGKETPEAALMHLWLCT
ncbi:asparaginase domain-containing protein [Falsirhodobacter sp. alg1]|uniref:asparaginase domain-containing protein n=1 Tax=Falsirhodobacter sp. alg1 TaxID=1472418 RepID=UPI0009E6B791|nr:asparaginase domain-containing protein [Falsirhodobacter sp. alg1]